MHFFFPEDSVGSKIPVNIYMTNKLYSKINIEVAENLGLDVQEKLQKEVQIFRPKTTDSNKQ